jgi:hypothetical protein
VNARVAFRAAAAIVAAASLFLWLEARTDAMPPFALAYGVKCSTCHTAVPALNAYGRYVQRTAYASLKRDVLNTQLPIWIGEQINGDSTGGVSDTSPTFTNAYGNLALHAAGYAAPDWTYHVQQWLLENDSTGGTLDTAWLTYNNLLHRDGHLFLGKVEAPAPSPFSQWMDLSAFVPPEIAVGEHMYQLDGNRWGTKFGYTHGALNAEAGYLWSSNGLLSSADFGTAPGTDKTFQYNVSSAPADHPLQVGVYGSVGSFIVSTGDVDRYTSQAIYVERDPQPHAIPGVFTIYQIANDSNPGVSADGVQFPGARSQALSAELYESMFNRGAVLSFRYEYSNDGLGDLAHYQTADFAFSVPHMPYLHGYFEAGLGANSTAPNGGPTWRWELWWTTPLARL